jgi:hypothetical protein
MAVSESKDLIIMPTAPHPEVWLRGPVPAIPSALSPVAHALLQAREDVDRLASDLTLAELWFAPGGAASAGFHLEHLAGALDRLFTYARDESLSDTQVAAMKREGQPGDPPRPVATLLAVVHAAIDRALDQLKATGVGSLQDVRLVGRARLPSTVIGLLFHAAEHAQRHAGQLATTVKVIRGLHIAD